MTQVSAKYNDGKSSPGEYSKNRRYRGTVKLYKEEKGYGFLKVHNLGDAFFHIKGMHASGIRSVQIGDTFLCNLDQNTNHDSRVQYKAHSFEKLQKQDGKSSRRGDNRSDAYSCGDSGTLVSIPHPKDLDSSHGRPNFEVTSHHGEIVVRSLNKSSKKFDAQHVKPIDMSSGRMKIGPPYTVPMMSKGPVVVSATGPRSAEMAPQVPEDPEIQLLNETIKKKKTLYRSLQKEKLPDGGRRLQDDITALEMKLQTLSMRQNTDKKDPRHVGIGGGKENQFPHAKVHAKSVPFKSTFESYPLVSEPYKIVFGKQAAPKTTTGPEKKSTQSTLGFPKAGQLGTRVANLELEQYDMGGFTAGQLYGGRMTNARLTEVRQVTKAAIEDLHKSLETRPAPDGQLEDPVGLKVTLMIHQRQALAWLVWRESQSMSGGILADDMGLGKTLTMISLILKQRENTEVKQKLQTNDEDEIEEFDSSTDSRDSDVILVEDDKEKVKEEIIVKEEEDVNDSNKEEKSSLIESDSTLIIAPASLLYHWENEIRNRCNKALLSIHTFHGPTRQKEPTRLAEFDVVITTYDIVRRCGSAKVDDKQESTLLQIEWRRIILDESHQIKNFKSQSSEAVCKLGAKTRWAMSGTPVQNNLTDMYAMLKFLHCRPFDEYKVWKHQVDNKTAYGKERLKTLISCIVLRRDKSDRNANGEPLVSLPERKFVVHKLKLNDVEREVYNKLQSDSKAAFNKFQEKKKHGSDVSIGQSTRNHSSGNAVQSTHACTSNAKGNSVTATTLLVMLLRMRQCCGHLSLLKESFDPELLCNEKKEMALEDMFQSMDINKTPVKMADINLASYVAKDKSKYFEKSSLTGKIEFVVDELNKFRFEKPDDKCVIVSQWTSMLEVVAYHLQKMKISYVIIKGSVPAKKRMDMVEEFNRNPVRPKVILLSLQAGGVGLNLVGGNHLYLLDMHWNPALESQAFDRIYRVGQSKPVFVHKFVVEDTVEERILKLQEHKLSLAKAVLEGAGSEDCKKLTLKDMKLLFGI